MEGDQAHGKKLYRTEGREALLFGVCGGIAEYFNLDPTLVRVVMVLLMWFKGAALSLYLIAAFLLPRKSTLNPGSRAGGIWIQIKYGCQHFWMDMPRPPPR